MAKPRTSRKTPSNAADTTASGATVGYEAQLWQMADALRGGMDAAIAANLWTLGFWDLA